MKKFILICSLITGIMVLAANSILRAQNNPDHKRTMHWYFGDKAGLDFSSGHPVLDTTGQMDVQQSSATISDTSGHLLFYTDGKSVWNRTGQVMPNGTGLGVGQYSTPYDCSVIIPNPGNNNIYYIFTVDGWQNQFKNGMRYHVVNMSLDNGKGAVIQKNIQLFTPCSEQLTATKDSSRCGYWVVGHELHTANFRAYHVTSAGVDTVPVISKTGIDYGWAQQYYYLAGGIGLKFTPDGHWAAGLISYLWMSTHINDQIDLLRFNKANGQLLSDVIIPIDTTVNGTMGFSPNSKYLYYEGGYYLAKDWQLDISSGDSATIMNSKTFIFSSGSNLGNAQDWQIGYDGKIYMEAEAINPPISFINKPNLKGIGCDYHERVISLNGRYPGQSFPRFVTNYLINDTSSICSLGINEPKIIENTFLVYPNPACDIIYIKSDNAIEQVKITDILGVTIFEEHKIRDESTINCQTFTNGIYIIQILTTNHKFLSTKLIINH